MSDPIDSSFAGTGHEHDTFDFVIVGAGSAGCVLANRLATAGARVAILEAGRDTPPTAVPADIIDTYPRSYFNEDYMWPGLRVDLGAVGRPGVTPFPQARVMGGGSSVMGMMAVRGIPDDYDAWAAYGAQGWAWSDVLPAFRRLETDWDFDGPLHGKDGPVAIRRHRLEDWPPFVRAVAEAASGHGFPLVDDMNGDFRDGYCRVPLSATLASRVSTASAYLGAKTRALANLSIECNTIVTRVLFEGTRCTGVEAISRGRRRAFRAAHVILTAGAIQSPTILLRSGIGPSGHLETVGVPTLVPLHGVGANLQNHPVVYLATHLRPEARQSALLRPQFNACLRFSSSDDPDMRSDMVILVMNKSSWHGLGQAVAGLGIGLYSPVSRGTVRLASANPVQYPDVCFGMLTDRRDSRRMMSGLRLALDLMQDPAVWPHRHELFATGYSETVRRLNRPSRWNVVITKLLAEMLDGPDVIRHMMIRWGIAHGDADESRMHDVSWMARTVQARTFGMYHPAGTCRMGDAPAAGAVVDTRCRVHGTDGLSVVDASVMPRLVRGSTNVPVIMVAEQAAELILRDAR